MNDLRGDPCAWLSVSHVKSELLFGFTCDLFQNDSATTLSRLEAFTRGGAIEDGHLPSVMWIRPQRAVHDRRKLPHLFSAAGLLTISEAFAEVLRDFDLGQTRLHPVELLHSNRSVPFPGHYYFLNIAEVRRYFSPEFSTRFEAMPNSATSYIGSVGNELQDDDVTLVPAARNGPDLWIDDTLLSHFFCSDRLAQALRAAKVTRQLPLFRCRVLQPS